MKRTSLGHIARAGLLVWVMLMFCAAPVLADVDLAGQWASRNHEDNQDKGFGPPLVQYWGIPINAAARNRALSYQVNILSVPERQCLDYGPQYRISGTPSMKIWGDYDPITGKPIAWHMSAFLDLPQVTIWVDGRPHPPPRALHTFAGFMTGKWVGDTLVVDVSNVKESYFRRNGVPASDKTTMTWYLSRHNDMLSLSAIIEDPVYLTEPYAVSKIFKEEPTLLIGTTTVPCVPADELPELNNHSIPQYEPGQNPNLNGMLELYGVPTAAALGGAETMYPEYQQTLIKDGYKTPKGYCGSYCCGWSGPAAAQGLLKCRIN
jgi:hypothetical protein